MHKSGQIGHLVPIYLNLMCTSTVRYQIAATDRARLHALAPRTGGDGAAVLRPLQQPQPPPLPTEEAAMTACSSSAIATIWRRVTRKARRPRSACATVPMLAAVLRVDSRWAPSSDLIGRNNNNPGCWMIKPAVQSPSLTFAASRHGDGDKCDDDDDEPVALAQPHLRHPMPGLLMLPMAGPHVLRHPAD